MGEVSIVKKSGGENILICTDDMFVPDPNTSILLPEVVRGKTILHAACFFEAVPIFGTYWTNVVIKKNTDGTWIQYNTGNNTGHIAIEVDEQTGAVGVTEFRYFVTGSTVIVYEE